MAKAYGDELQSLYDAELMPDGNIAVNRNVPLGSATASSVTLSYPFEFMVLNPVVRLVAPTSTTGGPITMTAATLMRNE